MKCKHLLGVCFLITVFINSSCTDGPDLDERLIDAFPEPLLLKGEQVFRNQYEVSSIKITDSLVVLSTRQDTIFHVYKVDGTYVTGFGRKGNGPGEFERSFFMTDFQKINNEVQLLIYDISKLKVVNVNLTRSILQNHIIVQEEFELPIELRHPVVNIHFLGNEKYIGRLDDRFYKRLNHLREGFIYDKTTENYEIFSLRNLKIKPFDIVPEINLNNDVVRISPDKKQAVFVLKYSTKLEIYDVESSVLRNLQLETDTAKEFYKLDDFKERRYPKYTEDMFVSNDYVYLLYDGETKEDDNPNSKQIKVLEWSGKPKAQYHIPAEYRLSRITVDEKNKVIYGLSWDNDAVYKFDFSEI